MKSLQILVLVHPDLIPPEKVKSKKIFDEEFVPWKTEYDVVTSLKKLGHKVLILGVDDSLEGIGEIIDSVEIDLVFNLLEQFDNRSDFDYKVTDFLKAKKIPFTGCYSEGLKLARDKGKSKLRVKKSGIKIPQFKVFPKDKKISLESFSLRFPLIVKCLNEESSLGLSKNSVVNNETSLVNRIKYLHKKLKVDCIVEEFIEGEEIYMGFMGGKQKVVFEPRKLHFPLSKSPAKEIYTSMAKWSYPYARRQKIFTRHRPCEPLLLKRLKRDTIKICQSLGIYAQARIDFRVTNKGEIYFLEANPNPNIAMDDDFAMAAIREFKSYEKIIEEIIRIAFERMKAPSANSTLKKSA